MFHAFRTFAPFHIPAMQSTLQLKLLPSEASSEQTIKEFAAAALACPIEDITGFYPIKRSIDARSTQPHIILTIQAFIKEPFHQRDLNPIAFQDVSQAKHSVIIIGAGPAGLFAALKLIQQGIKPILLERGKDVRARRRDLAQLNKEGIVNPESNYCFGEGGAGTYSDGKLYTRSNKRGDINAILNLFVQFGADPDILIDAHPHIGTNKLPQIIQAMRQQIIDAGGLFLFEKKVVDLVLQNGRVKHVVTSDGNTFHADAIILATGHSARDIFHLLHDKKILIEAKPFALGVRIEHPQHLIDQIQYRVMRQHSHTGSARSSRSHRDPSPHNPGSAAAQAAAAKAAAAANLAAAAKTTASNLAASAKAAASNLAAAAQAAAASNAASAAASHRPSFLPPAAYSLVQQVDHGGVFSFCMCPGGIIAPASTAPEELVVNGWSPSKRNNPFANSGIVVSVEKEDLKAFEKYGPLAALYFQQQVERAAYQAGGGKFVAPAQRMVDLVNNKVSSTLPPCSYLPGLRSTSMKDVLPGFIYKSLQQALPLFGKKMPGYYTSEAVLVATESRTSSPVRIPRDAQTLQHPQIDNLYPCGEGAGYAGGIVSAAMDGQRIAEILAVRFMK